MHIICMWITRHAEKLLGRMAAQFPAVLVTGARQAGKTSILRHLYPRAAYLSLDLPVNAEAADSAPEQLLDRFAEPLIIDEIQYAPSLLRYLKHRIDADRKPGRFLLTGSQVFSLMQGVSESLAGRCGVLNLHTLSCAELCEAGFPHSQTGCLFRGGYPELHVEADAELWFPAYVATYLERDVRNILSVVDLQDFNRFLRACALRTGQMLNYSDLARDTGIAPNTARKWLGLLQTSAVVTLIEPFFGNRTKRLIKAPKLAFLDTGLAAFLAGYYSEEDLMASPQAGAFWETHVFNQILKQEACRAVSRPICYWRSANGPEVDLVIELSGKQILAVECKLKEHPDSGDAAGLSALTATEKGRAVETIVVCRTAAAYRLADGTWVMNLPDLLQKLDASQPA
jgi:predicted AAA+ superfamily ATPase